MQEWNAAVQHQFGIKLSLDVAYVGNKTTHMQQAFQINDPNPGAGVVQNRRLRPQWGTISYVEVCRKRELTIRCKQNLTPANFNGATFLVSYTYAKCLTDGTYTTVVREDTPLINYYGVCSYDLKHNLVASALYELPLGHGRKFLSQMPGWANVIVGGWNLSNIATLQSGLPFTPTDQRRSGEYRCG